MKKNSSIIKATILVSFLTIIGKIFGFGRDAIIASYYGATADTDAYFFAQSMPGTIFPAVCSSLSIAFTSIYVKKIVSEGVNEEKRYATRMLYATAIIGILLGMLGSIIAPVLVPLIAVGFKGEQLALAVYLTQLAMSAFVLHMIQYMLCATLNAKKIFIAPQFAAVLYNVVIIATTLVVGKYKSMELLMFTSIFALLLQVCVLLFGCRRLFLLKVDMHGIKAEVKQLCTLALPILLGNSAAQINSIVEKILTSTLTEGALSALNYADTLSLLVTGVLVTSISTVLYPNLTTDIATGNIAKYNRTLSVGMRGLVIVMMPIACITWLDSREIVSIVYGRGNFREEAIMLTSVVLSCYAPRFIFYGVREILTKGFFAFQDTKTPMKNSVLCATLNILFSLLLVKKYEIAGVALGTTGAVIISTIILLVQAKKKFPGFSEEKIFKAFWKQAIAILILGGTITALHLVYMDVLPIIRFVLDTIVGFIVYLFVLLILKEDIIKEAILHIKIYVKKR